MEDELKAEIAKKSEELATRVKEVEDLKAKNLEFDKKIAELSKQLNPPSLNDKAKASEDEKVKMAELEGAVKFTMGAERFTKENEKLLTAEALEIFKLAEKENYGSAVLKAKAVKAALIQEYFKVQANVDSLTENQKISLESYLKLTKDGKEERAAQVFENIFEPALEMHRRVKKAEDLALMQSGQHNPSDAEKAYLDKMKKHSESYHLGKGK